MKTIVISLDPNDKDFKQLLDGYWLEATSASQMYYWRFKIEQFAKFVQFYNKNYNTVLTPNNWSEIEAVYYALHNQNIDLLTLIQDYPTTRRHNLTPKLVAAFSLYVACKFYINLDPLEVLAGKHSNKFIELSFPGYKEPRGIFIKPLF